jgi:hypothetical protein
LSSAQDVIPPSSPGETANLGADPARQADLVEMRDRLKRIVGHSLRPWFGDEYLAALNRLAARPVEGEASVNPWRQEFPLGSAQAYLTPSLIHISPPARAKEELLKSLPYQ